MTEPRNRGSPRLRFSKEELENPKLAQKAEKAEQAADRYDAAKKKLQTRRLKLIAEEIQTEQDAMQQIEADAAELHEPASLSGESSQQKKQASKVVRSPADSKFSGKEPAPTSPVTQASVEAGNASLPHARKKKIHLRFEETEAKPQPFEAQKTPQEEEEKTTLKDTVASAVSSRIPDDITPEELNSNPVIGWLVAIKGAHKGRSYEVKQGRNFIGRSTAMDICLSGNSKISRDRHAIITYDPRSKKCFLQPDETRDLIYINDELLFGPMPMKHNDVIVLADEEFVFLALQCDKADWM